MTEGNSIVEVATENSGKFLFDIHYPTFGGPHNQALRLAEALRQRGWDTTVLLPDEPGNAHSRLENGGVPVIAIPLRRLRATRDLRMHVGFLRSMPDEIARIRQIIRENDIQLVLIGGLYTVQTAIAARLERVPVVWQILDTVTPRVARLVLMQFVKAFADSIMTTGVRVAKTHPGAIDFGHRWVSYYPPVDTAGYVPSEVMRKRARAILGVPDDALLIGTVGNLNRTKGHQYLVDAAAMIAARHPQSYFRILGAYTPTHEAYASKLKERIESNEVLQDGRIDILDPKDRVADLLPAFDIFVSTSLPRSEGIPTTILEAMSTGLPVVATDVGSISEAVEHGVSGLIVPPLDTAAMVNAIVRLLDDSALRGSMGVAARERAVATFDVNLCADTHVRAFEVALQHATIRGALRRPSIEGFRRKRA